MRVKNICHICLLMLALGCFRAERAEAAPLSSAEAKKIALVRVPGTVMHEKLKHKKKKGHDYYSFKIKPRDHAAGVQWKKVEVDKETGQVLKVKNVKAKDYDE